MFPQLVLCFLNFELDPEKTNKSELVLESAILKRQISFFDIIDTAINNDQISIIKACRQKNRLKTP